MESENIYETPRPRASPAMLSGFTGQNVTVLGNVDPSTIASDGRSFSLEAAGDKINIQMATPLNEMMEGLVEVTGKVDRNQNVHCVVYRMLKSNTPFVFEDYHTTIEMIHKNPSLLSYK